MCTCNVSSLFIYIYLYYDYIINKNYWCEIFIPTQYCFEYLELNCMAKAEIYSKLTTDRIFTLNLFSTVTLKNETLTWVMTI